MSSFYKPFELKEFGFKSVGINVLISRKTSFYNPSNICIGNHVRIDDYCVIAAGEGGILIGSHVHIAIMSSIQGKGRVTISDFCGLSSRVAIYSSSDDYSGEFLTNPTVPNEFRGVTDGDVFLGKHVIIGSGSVILPNVVLEEGVAIGALSLVNMNCESYYIYTGNPIKKLIPRSRRLSLLENQIDK